MNSKETLLNVLRGKPTSRTPFAPFLTYWWDFNRVQKAESKGETGFKRSTGSDLLVRGHYDRPSHDVYEDLFVFSKRFEKTIVEEKITEKNKFVLYHTPIGELEDIYTYSPAGDTWFLTGHPVKNEEDFKILRYIINDYIIEPDSRYLSELNSNPDTLYAPLITPLCKTGFQSMIEHWVGTEKMAEFWMDCPEEIDETLEDIYKLSEKSARICADSEAEVFLSWEDSSTTNISPAWYRDYILPEINMWCDILHEKNKMYIQHACGHLKALAPLIAESKIDALESITSPPTGNTDIVEISKILPERITLIGGLEPTFLVNADDAAVKAKLQELVSELKGHRVILANADSCPPEVDINRFGLITKTLYEMSDLVPPEIVKY